jgi:hypothetical protein
MHVDDDSVFSYYHKIRKDEHIIVEEFIKDYFLDISVKSFLKKYRDWINLNNLEYIYWDVKEYLDWYSKKFNINDNSCYDYYNKIRNIKVNFTPLTLATAIFYLTNNVDKNEIKALSGMSITPINECIRFLENLDVKIDIKHGEVLENVHIQ